MTNTDNLLHIQWSDIETALETLQHADGGFSSAHRGIVTLANGKQVFAKIGVDENTRAWAKKEIAVYRFLQKHSYPYIPKLLAVNEDETAFALEPLDKADGWDWSETWTKTRLDKTLEAMDALAVIAPTGVDKTFFEHVVIDAADNGWRPLADSTDKQQVLLAKLRTSGYGDTAEALDLKAMAQKSEQYTFMNDQLVHNDIRADNAAWNSDTSEIKLVDWNWMQFGDRRLDLSAMLTHVQKSGFDLLPEYTSCLDADALQWMAGFWFNSATKPIWPGGPEHLREHQLKAGVTALELSRQVQQMNVVTIEKAQPQDAEAITEVQAITWLATYPNAELGITEADIRQRLEGDHGERTAKRIEQWSNSIESGSSQEVYIARLNSKVVGFTAPMISLEGQHRIGALYVLPEAQGKGVGSRLMEENLAWHGDDQPVYLTVAAYNQNAINFYKKFGFQETDQKVEDLPARKRGLKEIPEIEMMRPALEKS